MTLQFLAAAFLDHKIKATTYFPVSIKYSLGVVVMLIITGLLYINLYPGTFGNKTENELGSGDFTLDLYGWPKAGVEFGNWIKQDDTYKFLPVNNTIVCNNWFPAAHFDYYIARKFHMQVIGVGTINDLHHYAWLNHYKNDLQKGDSSLCIIPSNYSVNLSATYLKYFNSAQLLHIIFIRRMHTIVRYFKIYLLTGYRGNDETHNILVK
jgi:alkyl hydroperoxide reductase subunit AhpC